MPVDSLRRQGLHPAIAPEAYHRTEHDAGTPLTVQTQTVPIPQTPATPQMPPRITTQSPWEVFQEQVLHPTPASQREVLQPIQGAALQPLQGADLQPLQGVAPQQSPAPEQTVPLMGQGHRIRHPLRRILDFMYKPSESEESNEDDESEDDSEDSEYH